MQCSKMETTAEVNATTRMKTGKTVPNACFSDRISTDFRRSGGILCFACNHSGHFARSPSCPARDKKCWRCDKKGHFAACKSQPVHQVAQEVDITSATPLDGSFSIGAIHRKDKSCRPIVVS